MTDVPTKTSTPSLFKKVQESIYTVRSPAGFEQALKNWLSSYDPKRYTDHEVDTAPSRYPAMVIFSWEHVGKSYKVKVRCVPFKTLTDAMQRSDKVVPQKRAPRCSSRL